MYQLGKFEAKFRMTLYNRIVTSQLFFNYTARCCAVSNIHILTLQNKQTKVQEYVMCLQNASCATFLLKLALTTQL